jgi:hypothetical protein
MLAINPKLDMQLNKADMIRSRLCKDILTGAE